jgi:hypothetical protein
MNDLRLIALVLLLGCSSGPPRKSAAADSLTERQRDSILAQSKIPGARGVGAALRASDSISARVRAADTIAQ